MTYNVFGGTLNLAQSVLVNKAVLSWRLKMGSDGAVTVPKIRTKGHWQQTDWTWTMKKLEESCEGEGYGEGCCGLSPHARLGKIFYDGMLQSMFFC